MARFPFDPQATWGVANVLRTGVAELYADIDDAMVEAAALPGETKELIRRLALRSLIIVPIRVGPVVVRVPCSS